MVSALALVVTESAIEVTEGFVLTDILWDNISTFIGIIVSVLIALQQVNRVFTKVLEALKLKASEGDVQGIASILNETHKLLKQIKELEEISAFANIDNKFLDEETKAAFARAINDYNTAETLTKEQFIKIKSLLEKPKE